ncbi:hypothetical protein QFZ76_000140 [Streptomyces sp. V4I2]|nr:hypothetical protein [Streptomyces sp. V4I2]
MAALNESVQQAKASRGEAPTSTRCRRRRPRRSSQPRRRQRRRPRRRRQHADHAAPGTDRGRQRRHPAPADRRRLVGDGPPVRRNPAEHGCLPSSRTHRLDALLPQSHRYRGGTVRAERIRPHRLRRPADLPCPGRPRSGRQRPDRGRLRPSSSCVSSTVGTACRRADPATDSATPQPGTATACSLPGVPDRPLHLKLHPGPHRALLFRMHGDRGLHVLGKVAPCLPRGLVSGRVALVA